jgi:thioredoxin 1
MEVTPMSVEPVRTVTEQTFEADVLASRVPVLVDFTAAWCPPCRALAPILHRMAEEGAGRFSVRTVDGDGESVLAARLRVKAFPTVVAFAGGQEVGRHVGLTTREKLLRLIAAHL